MYILWSSSCTSPNLPLKKLTHTHTKKYTEWQYACNYLWLYYIKCDLHWPSSYKEMISFAGFDKARRHVGRSTCKKLKAALEAKGSLQSTVWTSNPQSYSCNKLISSNNHMCLEVDPSPVKIQILGSGKETDSWRSQQSRTEWLLKEIYR